MIKIWTEKYRPKVLEGIVGNAEITRELSVIEGKPPHLFFSGKAGTGKTTAAKALARKLLGKEWRKNTLVLNSSDERGIDVVRDKIKKFAGTKGFAGGFKIVLLDEVDNMTKDAQQALRGTMEEFADNTSFILTCNYPHKVIDPIKSRCSTYNFKPISKDQTMRLIAKIVTEENLEIDPQVGEIIAENARGDMRRVLHELEGLSKLRRRIKASDVRSLPKNQVEVMAQTILTKEPNVFPKARDMMLKLVKDGEDPAQIIDTMFQTVMNTPKPGNLKLSLFMGLAQYEYQLKMGANPEIQLMGLLAYINTEVNRYE